MPTDEAVRVFVKFVDTHGSSRAVQSLTGRYFGGRLLRVDYFPEERFDRHDLVP